MKGWTSWIIVVFVLSIVIHAAVLYGLPGMTMKQVMHNIKKTAGGSNSMLHAPRPNANARRIPRPSPDMLYSVCALDVSKGPVRIFAPVSKPYTSISIFSDNSDNLLTKNDLETKGDSVELIVAKKGQKTDPGKTVVLLPSDQGVALVRYVIKDEQHASELRLLRREANCKAL